MTAEPELIRWDAAGPYEVFFSTRQGGVSDGPYASLNLGRKTGDDVERVDENRRRACTEIGADGKPATVVSETRMVSPNHEEVTFTAPDGHGRTFTRMAFTTTRRAD